MVGRGPAPPHLTLIPPAFNPGMAALKADTSAISPDSAALKALGRPLVPVLAWFGGVVGHGDGGTRRDSAAKKTAPREERRFVRLVSVLSAVGDPGLEAADELQGAGGQPLGVRGELACGGADGTGRLVER